MNHELQPFVNSANYLLKEFLKSLPYLFLALCIIIFFYFIAKLCKRLITKLLRHKHNNLSLVLGRISQWMLLLFGIFISMLVIFPSFEAADFIAGLGIGSIAIGFAFKDIFQNLLCGILILLSEPFKIGNQIKINNGEYEGTVTSIETRATFITTFDGQCVVIPNAKLYTDTVLVETKYKLVRTKIEIGVNSDCEAGRVINIILDTITQHKAIATQAKPTVRLDSFGDFANVYVACWWTNIHKNSLLEVKSEILRALQVALSKANIDMPLPTQNVKLIFPKENNKV